MVYLDERSTNGLNHWLFHMLLPQITSKTQFEAWVSSADPTPAPDIRIPTNIIKGCDFATWLDVNCQAKEYCVQIDSSSQYMRMLLRQVVAAIQSVPSSDIHQVKFRDLHSVTRFMTTAQKKSVQLVLNTIHSSIDNAID